MEMNKLDTLIERALLAIDDGEWEAAEDFINRALDENFKCAKAYILKFLISQKATSVSEVKCSLEVAENDANIKKARRFANDEDTAQIGALFAVLEEQAVQFNRAFEENKARAALSDRVNPFIVLNSDGTVTTSYPLFKEALGWSEITSISVRDRNLIGVKSNGKVVFCGEDVDDFFKEALKWDDIIKAEATDSWIVGMDRQGNLHICGEGFKQDIDCDLVESWTSIVDFGIALKERGIYAISSDGKVKKSGILLPINSKGEELIFDEDSIEQWEDIESISFGVDYALGLQKNGSVMSCGNNKWHQRDVETWRDIIQIFCSAYCSVGLKSDGTMVQCGNCDGLDNCCDMSYVKEWRDVKYFNISLDGKKGVGVKSDGTVEHFGLGEKPSEWTDIVSVSICFDEAVVITQNGFLETTLPQTYGLFNRMCSIYRNHRIFQEYNDIANEFAKLAPSAIEISNKKARILENNKYMRTAFLLRANGRCQYCGKEFKGTWRIKCSACKHKLDYKLPKHSWTRIIKDRVIQICTLILTLILLGFACPYIYRIYQGVLFDKKMQEQKEQIQKEQNGAIETTDTSATESKEHGEDISPSVYVRDGEYVFFGMFPQSLSNNASINQVDGEYVDSSGATYTKISYSDVTAYFKNETIKWRVIEEDSTTMTLMCDCIIAAHGYGANNYEESEIRTYLNEAFLQSAFDAAQQSSILSVTLDNGIQDKVWLLSFEEVEWYLTKGNRILERTPYVDFLMTHFGKLSLSAEWCLRSTSDMSGVLAGMKFPVDMIDADGEKCHLSIAGASTTTVGIVPVVKITK